jgi:hypothetical protein
MYGNFSLTWELFLLGRRPSVAFETIQNIVRLRIKDYGIRRQEGGGY